MATITTGHNAPTGFTSGEVVTATKLNAHVNSATVTGIVNADVDAAAAIAGTKIAPDFGSQNVVTTGSVTAKDATVQADDSSAAVYTSRASEDGGPPYVVFDKARGTQSSKAVVQSGDQCGQLLFRGYDGSTTVSSAAIACYVDGTPGANDMPGRLVFSTTADGGSSLTERMRITSNGEVNFGTANNISVSTGTDDGATFYSSFSTAGVFQASNNNNYVAFFRRRAGNGGVLGFYRDTTPVGNIAVSTTATAYNTASDYRLKQNVEPMASGLAKLAALAPKTFEFKAEPNVKVDGFIAHEVQEVVPHAVTGEKDGEEMQGLDMSKLVPVLVAAVQELSAKVTALESAQNQ